MKKEPKTFFLFGLGLLLFLGGGARGLEGVDEAAILRARGDSVLLFRFLPAPSVIVAVFPSLHAQALALNRAAALLEMSGAPRGRVLDDAGLSAAIGRSGADFDRFYLGHDYRAGDLHLLWRLEVGQGVPPTREEAALRSALLTAERSPGGFAVLISLPQAASGGDEVGRAAILRHELSHALYFTDARYAAYARGFWMHVLDEAQRAAMRAFLARGAYDPGNEDLMINEAQAYLVNTPDARLFSPELVPLPAETVRRWRSAFVASMPDDWLKSREAP